MREMRARDKPLAPKVKKAVKTRSSKAISTPREVK